MMLEYQSTMKRSGKCNDCSSQCSESQGEEYRLRSRKQHFSSSRQQKSRRVSQAKKQQLILMVTRQNYRIKEAGRYLGISYSTAKKIFTNFRLALRGKSDELLPLTTCCYCDVGQQAGAEARRVNVVSTVAGNIQGLPIIVGHGICFQ